MVKNSEVEGFDVPDFLRAFKSVDVKVYAERFGKDPKVFTDYKGFPWALYEYNPDNKCFQDFATNYKGMSQAIQDNTVYNVVVFKGVQPVLVMNVSYSPAIPNNKMEFLKFKLIGFWENYTQSDFDKATYSIRNAVKTIMLLMAEDCGYFRMTFPTVNERLDLPKGLEDVDVSGLVIVESEDRGSYFIGFSDSL